MRPSGIVSAFIVAIPLAIVLAACNLSPFLQPDQGLPGGREFSYVNPSYAHIFEGSKPAVLSLNRSEIPIALSFAAERASAWMIVYEIDGQIMHYLEFGHLDAEFSPLQLADVTKTQFDVSVEYEQPWSVLGTYLERSIYMEVPGTRTGTRDQLIFFTRGVPQALEVEADPVRNRFVILAIESEEKSKLLVSTDSAYSQVIQVAPETRGLIIRSTGPWTLRVLDDF